MPRKARDKGAVSTLAADRALADQVRDTAKKNGMTTLELTNQLLGFALKQGKLTVEVRSVVITPAKTR